MVSILLQGLIAVIIVSFIALIGLVVLARREWFKKSLFVLMSFAAGTFLAVALLDLLPESVASAGPKVFFWALAGMVLFFLIEKVLHWYHGDPDCVDCKPHGMTYLNLISDALHNLVDGALIMASFMTSPATGIAVTIAVALHEIPQEISDFAILVKGGFSVKKALLFNFLSGFTALIGALIAFFALSAFESLEPFIIAFAAGGLLYIALVNVIPEIHKTRTISASLIQALALIAGIAVMMGVGVVVGAV